MPRKKANNGTNLDVQLLKKDLDYIKLQMKDIASDVNEIKKDSKENFVTKYTYPHFTLHIYDGLSISAKGWAKILRDRFGKLLLQHTMMHICSMFFQENGTK